MREVEIAIVGAGPAGMAAAAEAAASGAEVLLVDEYRTMGGQFYKQVPDAFAVDSVKEEGRQYAEGADIIQKVKAAKVELMLGTVVWGIFDGRTLAVYRDDRVELIRPSQLIIATGAQEVPVAFPGWTLPGVILGGGAQSLLVSQRVLPGRKVVMAGVGPLQLKVASQLLEAGAEVVAILEASSKPPVSMENALRSFGHWGKMREGLEYWLKVKRSGIPYRHQHIPVRALGKDALEAVVVAQVDEDWRTVPGTEETLEADTLCLSYGFLPSGQLARLADCRAVYDPAAGGWITWHDADQQTSVEGIYVAGEVGGIGGADVAEAEGKIAGIMAARALGRLKADGRKREEARARKRLEEARGFAQVANEMMRLKPGLFELITDDTVVCRCEEVTAAQVNAALADGDFSLRGVKVRTRAGMGLCQGRMCNYLVSRLIARATGKELSEIELDTPRPPVKPIPLAALAAGFE